MWHREKLIPTLVAVDPSARSLTCPGLNAETQKISTQALEIMFEKESGRKPTIHPCGPGVEDLVSLACNGLIPNGLSMQAGSCFELTTRKGFPILMAQVTKRLLSMRESLHNDHHSPPKCPPEPLNRR